MACYFCRDINVDMIVHDACKTITARSFESKPLCPKCGKCEKCDHDELIEMMRNQKYAILQISKRRFAIIHLENTIALRYVGSLGYLGPHLRALYVEECENLSYSEAHTRLADLLYNPNSEWKSQSQ